MFSTELVSYFPRIFRPATIGADFNVALDREKPVENIVSDLTDNPNRYGAALRRLVSDFRDVADIARETFIEAHTHFFTGLGNRRLFEKTASEEIRRVGADESRGATVILLDVDKLHAINSAFGYKAGDEFLKLVAQNLDTLISGNDLEAHIGGDEFAILITDEAPEKGAQITQAVRDLFTDLYFTWGDHSIPVRASVGAYSLTAGTEYTYSEVMSHADSSLKAEKERRAPARDALEAQITDQMPDPHKS